MAIRIITGVPGSGKSYYGVKHLRDTYFKYDKDERLYVPRDDVRVFANIDDLKLEHTNLNTAIEQSKLPIEKFFTVPYQEKIVKKYNKIVYFIDEAQRIFPDNFRDQDTFYLFQYHRHLGIDFYLMTQSFWLLPKGIRELIEFEVRAVRSSLSLFGELKYNVKSSGEIIDKKILRKDKKIFALYKSMDVEASEKLKNPMIKYIVASLVLLVCSLFLFKNTFFGGAVASASNDEKAKVVQNQNYSPNLVRLKSVKPVEPVGIMVKLSWVMVGNILQVVDPKTGDLIPVHDYQYKTVIKTQSGRMRVYAFLPPEASPPADPALERGLLSQKRGL